TGSAFAAQTHAVVTLTDLTNFPGGPFPHTSLTVPGTMGTAGATANPVSNGTSVGFNAGTGAIVLSKPNAFTFFNGPPVASLTHPALGAAGGLPVTVYDQRSLAEPHQADLVFRTGQSGLLGEPTPLTQLNSKAFDETRPSFSPDGRYLAFVS